MHPEELRISISSGTLSARVWGPADGRPVLGLHGWLDNGATFDRIAPRLPGIRLVSLDLAGHGRSDWRPAGDAYLFYRWIQDAVEAADALGWDTFSVLGHSMGAAVSGMLAGTVPARVTRLVLIEGLAPLVYPDEDAPQRFADALEAASDTRAPRVFPDLDTAIARRREAAGVLSEEGARCIVERGTEPVDGGVRFTADPRLRSPSMIRFTEGQVRVFLSRIECSVLLIRAENGWPFDETLVRERAECIRDHVVHTLPGGHHVHLDEPESVAAIVAPFLA